jgi:radical SAM protein with 4Fe4S-binding SPASM domain
MEEYDVARYGTVQDYAQNVPVTVVWELTLACNLNCRHCGSRAGKVRPKELTLQECFNIIEQLKKLGTREIGLIGGEVFLKKDWVKIIEKIVLEGIDCNMQTGGFNLTEEKILLAKRAGIQNIGISIDGLRDSHNYTRNNPAAYDHAINSLILLHKNEVSSSVNTTITSRNKHELEEMLEVFISYGVKNWQLQLAVAMGNAVENNDLLLQPFEVKGILDNLAALFTPALAAGMVIQPANNLGYFGVHEHKWRPGNFGHYVGCAAGQTAIGIEADGTIKGCPSLPTKDYAGGNVKDLTIEDIWKTSSNLSFARNRNVSELWGFCRTCYYAPVCLAGCSWTSHVLLGKRGNNPYCYHRVTELEKQQKRERVRKVQAAEGKPFDYGLFELVTEDLEGNVLEIQKNETIEAIPNQPTNPRQIHKLHLCKNCHNHIYTGTEICPFCSCDVQQVERQYHTVFDSAKKAANELSMLMDEESIIFTQE